MFERLETNTRPPQTPLGLILVARAKKGSFYCQTTCH